MVIEQSELDAAIAAIRAAFEAPASAASSETGPARLVKRLEEVLDVPRDQWPPSALRAFWEPLRDLAEQRLEEPAARVALVQPRGFLPAARPGLSRSTRSGSRPSGRSFIRACKHIKDVQCWAEWWILWRRVAAGLAPSAPRRDLSPARSVPAARQGLEPVQESRPAQARAARAGRDVALRRQPGATGPRGEGGSRRAA